MTPPLTPRERSAAQRIVEEQTEAIIHLRRLLNHRTVQTNPHLSQAVERAWQSLLHANALTCTLWFPHDTLRDVREFLPPPPDRRPAG